MFKLRQDDYQVQTRHALLDNTLTVYVGDVIQPINGFASVVSNATTALLASPYVLGVVTGFCYKNLQVIGQGQNPSLTPNQYTTVSNNTTLGATAAVYATYIPITEEMIWLATLSATAATTAGSDQSFVWFNLTDARTVNEASVVDVFGAGTPLSVFSYGVAPEDTSSHTIICRFAKSLNDYN
jgi:hypothetical protein